VHNFRMHQLLVGLVLFLGIHCVSIVAPRGRDRWATAMGPNLWRALYSLIAIAGFVLLIRGYAAARLEPVVVYVPPGWTRHLTMLLMLPVFVMLFAAYLPGRIKATLKHPMLVAVKLWAVAHLLANGMLADLLLFGGFLAWAVLDRISLKRRVPRPVPGAPASRWNDLAAIVLGLASYAIFVVWLHQRLIGVPVLLAR
jgi:uncharacterized membrane protein